MRPLRYQKHMRKISWECSRPLLRGQMRIPVLTVTRLVAVWNRIARLATKLKRSLLQSFNRMMTQASAALRVMQNIREQNSNPHRRLFLLALNVTTTATRMLTTADALGHRTPALWAIPRQMESGFGRVLTRASGQQSRWRLQGCPRIRMSSGVVNNFTPYTFSEFVQLRA